MDLMNRRGFLRGILGGAAVATLATTAGMTLLSNTAEAAPVPADKNLPQAMEDFAETVQHRHGHHHHHHHHRRRHWHHHHHRRHRRRHCWWHRGHRHCAWR